ALEVVVAIPLVLSEVTPAPEVVVARPLVLSEVTPAPEVVVARPLVLSAVTPAPEVVVARPLVLSEVTPAPEVVVARPLVLSEVTPARRSNRAWSRSAERSRRTGVGKASGHTSSRSPAPPSTPFRPPAHCPNDLIAAFTSLRMSGEAATSNPHPSEIPLLEARRIAHTVLVRVERGGAFANRA